MSKLPKPSATADKILLRVPDGMRDRLVALARSNNRSTTAEIVACLQARLDEPDNPFLRFAVEGRQAALRSLSDELAVIVEQLDAVVGTLDAAAWRAGAYTVLDDDPENPPSERYQAGTPQFASWVAGRAFAVAAQLKRTVREMQGLPEEQEAPEEQDQEGGK